MRKIGSALALMALGAVMTVPVATATAGAQACDPNYAGACVPPPPPDLDCDDIREPVRIVGQDPHNLDDADPDNIGCEEYGTFDAAGTEVHTLPVFIAPPLQAATAVQATPNFTG